MLFTYILSGWEGSATDSHVWADALAKGFPVPEDSIIWLMWVILIARNFLFLFMAFSIIFRSGELQVFGMCFVMFLFYFIVFCKKSYSPANTKELFNLRHAQACNVIKHIFGVLKQHFRILLLPPHYPLDFQACIPVALCTLQNFIQKIDHDEGELPTDPYQAAYTPFSSDIDDHYEGGLIEDDDEEDSEVIIWRKNIANEMWRSYLDYMAGVDTSNSDDNSSELNM